MTRLERMAAERLIERAVAPVPPLPPVAATDAVAALCRQIAAGPPLNRAGLRVALLARAAGLPVGQLERALESLAHFSYYGDAGVMRLLGYAP